MASVLPRPIDQRSVWVGFFWGVCFNLLNSLVIFACWRFNLDCLISQTIDVCVFLFTRQDRCLRGTWRRAEVLSGMAEFPALRAEFRERLLIE